MIFFCGPGLMYISNEQKKRKTQKITAKTFQQKKKKMKIEKFVYQIECTIGHVSNFLSLVE